MKKRRLNLKLKLNIYILGAASLIFCVTIGYISYQISQVTYRDAIDIVKGSAREYQAKISGELTKMAQSAKTIANAHENYLNLKPSVRDEVYNQILLSNLKKNSQYLSVGVYWELKALDKNYRKRNGRHYNGYFRHGNKIVTQTAIEDTTDQVLHTTYYQIKEQNRLAIVNPYYDQTTEEVKGILMTSLLAPIQDKDGRFEGMVGIDISLSEMNHIISKVKPYKEAVSYMISENRTIVAHTNTSLTGRNLTSSLGKDSTFFQKEILGNKSLVHRSFTYRNSSTGIEYFVAFEPITIDDTETNWFIGIEVPTKVIFADARGIFTRFAIAGLISLLLFVIVIYLIAEKITSPILKGVAFARAIADGNLNAKFPLEQNDEIGDLADSLSAMANRLKLIIQEIIQSSDRIAESVEQLFVSSTDLAEGAGRQAASSEEISTSMELVVSRVQKNTLNAKKTEQIALQASENIQKGESSTQELIVSMNNIVQKASIINEIAKQTNLLAINAAIEASRLGIQGKGFGVVATEIKKLAERAHEAAKEINELSKVGVDQASEAEKILLEIVPEIQQTSELVKQITTASLEQGVNSEEINVGIQQLNKVTQQNAGASFELSVNAKNIAEQSENLKRLISYFKVDTIE